MFNFFQSLDGETYGFTTAGYTLFAIVLLALVLVACFFTGKDNKKSFSTTQLVISAMCIALGFVTSNIKLFRMPQGGSITLFSMFFVCFVGFLYGTKSGIMAGVAYGILGMLIDPYIISIPQMLFDYIFAFGALGLSGITRNKKYGLVSGYIIGIAGRMFFAVLSGIIFFGMYAGDTNVFIYSFSYNGLYIITEAVITVIVLSIPAVKNALFRVKKMALENEDRKDTRISRTA